MSAPDLHPVRVPRRKRRNNSDVILNRGYRAIVVAGMEFSKFKYGRAKRRVLWVDPMLANLYWGAPDDVRLPSGRYNVAKAKGSIPLNDIASIVVDRKMHSSKCPLFARTFHEHPDTCVSIVTGDRTLDLQADTAAACQQWATSLANITFGDRSQFAVGEEDDDFDDDEDDAKVLFESDDKAPDGASAVEAYAKVYHTRRLTRDMMSEIERRGSLAAHCRSHSYITKVLMDQDARFRKLAEFVQRVREEFGADRGALYLVSHADQTVKSVVIEGQQGDVRSYEFNQDLVGVVAVSGDILIVPDAYADPRFSQEYDVEASYKTTSVLIAPVRDRARRIVAVLEFRNRQDHQYTKDYFTVEHAAKLQRHTLEMRDILAVLQDHDFQKTMQKVQDPMRLFSDRSPSAHHATTRMPKFDQTAGSDTSDTSSTSSQTPVASRSPSPVGKRVHRSNSSATTELLQDAIFREVYDALQTARARLHADRASLFAVQNGDELHSVILEGFQHQKVVTKVGEGLPGACARQGAPIVVDDAYEDARFDKEADKAVAYKTTSVLCVPVADETGVVIGVCQFTNKQDMPFKKAFFKMTDAACVVETIDRIARALPSATVMKGTPMAMTRIDENDQDERTEHAAGQQSDGAH
ncbi:hypothetical protein PBRA_002108 [Plasmodiophora brassicae]|nr:hypothetical protein PBRA_002108 [Plasmodiophora brassicae]